MPEVKREVKTYEVTYACDYCDGGVMQYLGTMLMSDPPKYVHECNVCDNTLKSLVQYPTIKHELI